jgi:hypothetical protein
MLRNGFICQGGGEAGAHRLESNIPSKKAKIVQKKMLNIFVMQKCSDGDKHFSEHFFQSWNEIANTQKIHRVVQSVHTRY